MKKILIVPTIRENCINEFLSCWQDKIDNIIVVEDNPEKTFKLSDNIIHYAWDDILKDLGKNEWIISRRDSAIRSYGFMKAYALGGDYFYTLDDDCFYLNNDFFNKHIEVLENTPRWRNSIRNQRHRGLPYKNLGMMKNVVLNAGFWCGVPDQDAINQLANPVVDYMPPLGNEIIAKGEYVNICGMNLCFKREIACLSYFPIMGMNSKFRRFDDIWSMIIVTHICHHLNLKISIGEPFIEHRRASDPFKNLIAESPGVQANEYFWEIIDEIKLTALTPKNCMYQVGEALSENKDEYFRKLGKAIKIWTTYFN